MNKKSKYVNENTLEESRFQTNSNLKWVDSWRMGVKGLIAKDFLFL